MEEASPLTQVSVGGWAARSPRERLFLVIPADRTRLVFVVDRTRPAAKSPGRSRLVSPSQWRPLESPFCSATYKDSGCVSTFEVLLDDVVGLDYRNRLHDEARLVLEAQNVRKREFKAVSGRARGRAVSAEHGASYRLPLVGTARIAPSSSSHPVNRRTPSQRC